MKMAYVSLIYLLKVVIFHSFQMYKVVAKSPVDRLFITWFKGFQPSFKWCRIFATVAIEAMAHLVHYDLPIKDAECP